MNIFQSRYLGLGLAISLLLSATIGILPSYAADHQKTEKKESVNQNQVYHLHKDHALLESPQYPKKSDEWMQETAGERQTHGGQVIILKW